MSAGVRDGKGIVYGLRGWSIDWEWMETSELSRLILFPALHGVADQLHIVIK